MVNTWVRWEGVQIILSFKYPSDQLLLCQQKKVWINHNARLVINTSSDTQQKQKQSLSCCILSWLEWSVYITCFFQAQQQIALLILLWAITRTSTLHSLTTGLLCSGPALLLCKQCRYFYTRQAGLLYLSMVKWTRLCWLILILAVCCEQLHKRSEWTNKGFLSKRLGKSFACIWLYPCYLPHKSLK